MAPLGLLGEGGVRVVGGVVEADAADDAVFDVRGVDGRERRALVG